MGNDLTWEQKCRISALRAACASSFDWANTNERLDPEHYDDAMTERILARAEAFRIALLAGGALDYTPDDDEATRDAQSKSGAVANCTRCLRAITWLQPPGFEGRWIDSEGISMCHNNDRSYGDHTIEPVQQLCPGCGSSRKDTPLMINDGMGDSLQCNHRWHRE